MRAHPRGVFERPPGSNIWWVCYFKNGRRHREKVGPMALAVAVYQKRKTEIREHKFFPDSIRKQNVPFQVIADEAIEFSKAHHSLAGHENTKRNIELAREWFKGYAAEEIKPADIERKLAKLASDGLAPATINRLRSAISLVFSVAMASDKVARNPVSKVVRRVENNARSRFLDPTEEIALREYIREHFPTHEAELDLALHTGMRRGEQYRLRWTDVDLVRGIITIPRSKHGEKRFIQINSVAHAAFERLRGNSGSGDYVVARGRTTAGRVDSRWFECAVRALGIVDFRWHDLRHTFASRLVMAGVDLRTVQELMGHKSIAMTERYAHVSDGHKQEAIERIAGDTVGPAPRAVPAVAQRPFVVRKTAQR